MELKYTITITDHFDNIKEVLKTKFEISDRLLTKLKKNNLIFVNNSIANIKTPVNSNDIVKISLDYDEDNTNIVSKKMGLKIVFEDDAVLVLNKPAGLPVHPSMLHYEDSLSNGVKFYYDSIVICVDKHNYVPCVVTFHPNIRIQNETIDNTRVYAGKDIQIGRNVLNNKPQGNVIIGQDAKVDIHGGNVVLQPGTFIKRGANVRINQLE